MSARIALVSYGTALLLVATAACGPEDDPASTPRSAATTGGSPTFGVETIQGVDIQMPAESMPPDDESPAGGPGDEPAGEPVETVTRTVLLIPGTTITGDYFDEMAARLSADGYDPVVYEPPDLLTEGLALGAERIDVVVRSLLEEQGESRLHIVAECNGGVATRYWLQVLGGEALVDQVVTFVSAHHGTWSSPIGEWVTGFDSLDDITPGSAFLDELGAAPFPTGLQLTSIYSCWDELLWPWDTSRVEGAVNVEFCDYYIGHFDGFWDPVVYGRILQALRGEGDAAPTAY